MLSREIGAAVDRPPPDAGGAPGVDVTAVDLMRRIALVGARINSGAALQETLQAVADGVVEALGFGVAVVNFLRPDGDFAVLAINGPADLHAALQGQAVTAAAMQELMARSVAWGALRFCAHHAERAEGPTVQTRWTPDIPAPDDPDGWHPDNVLLAPLHSASGVLVGILSVDLPPGLRRPSLLLLEMLEIFAVQAGIAIDNARLAADLLAEQAELRREQARLRASESAFRFSFTGSASAMAMLSLEAGELGRALQVNDAFRELLGDSAEQLTHRSWPDLLRAEDAAADRQVLVRFAAGELTDLRTERRMDRPDGAALWLQLTETALHPGPGQPSFVLLHADDITERKSHEGRLVHQAAHDALTGLPNRRLLAERLTAAIDRARRTGRPGVLFFCDADGFKELNDRFGHAAGDRVLAEVAERLLGAVRTRDTVARLGGDEFVVIAEDLAGEAVGQFVDRLREAVGRPLTAVPGRLGLSIGAAPIDPGARGGGPGDVGGPDDPGVPGVHGAPDDPGVPGDPGDPAELLRWADAAMYRDKLSRVGSRPARRPETGPAL